jgi:hypothetical protein
LGSSLRPTDEKTINEMVSTVVITQEKKIQDADFNGQNHFRESDGKLLVTFLDRGTTENSDLYMQILKKLQE